MNEKVVMFDSDDSAQIYTSTGWTSRHGRYFGLDEKTARYDGCTHLKCSCGEVIPRNQIFCETCREKKADEKWLAMPKEDWDYESPINLYGTDTYFSDADELIDFCDENAIQPKDLKLVHCKAVYAKQIDPNDHYSDSLAEDGDVPQVIKEAFDVLNSVIKTCNLPLSWTTKDVAVNPYSLPTIESDE